MARQAEIDVLLSTLNAAEVGSLESIAGKLQEARGLLDRLGEAELAVRADDTVAALRRGDVAEFKRGKAYLQAKIGHLR